MGMLPTVEECETRYNTLYSEVFETFAQARDFLDSAEMHVTKLFGGTHKEYCGLVSQDRGDVESVEMVPTLLTGAANKIRMEVELLSYYHLARWHRDEMHQHEMIQLAFAIQQHEYTINRFKFLKERAEAMRAARGIQTPAETATQQAKNLLDKIFGKDKPEGEGNA